VKAFSWRKNCMDEDGLIDKIDEDKEFFSTHFTRQATAAGQINYHMVSGDFTQSWLQI
jgi:hypothetical protein